MNAREIGAYDQIRDSIELVHEATLAKEQARAMQHAVHMH